MKKSTIILTGGAGFIGSCFLWKLNKEGIDNIIVVDNLDSSDKWRNLAGKKFLDYVQKDVFIALLNENKIKNVKMIVHMGACSSTTLNDGAYFIKNNYEYSKSLAVWAKSNKAKFIYASSAATYGAGEFGYDDSNKTTYRLRPLNMYGYSKQLFDLWILNNNLDKEATGIKFFNVFGPNEYHKGEMMSVVCKKFTEVNQTGRIGLFKSYRDDYKDGEQKRDFIYIKDAIDVLFYFFENSGRAGIFNLGCGKAHSWNDLAHAIFLALEKKPRIEYIDMPEILRSKYQYFTEAMMERLRISGYDRQFTPLKDAVKDYISYLRENKYL
ncbi:MAG: ADP-glyceromanno-heptose 6-epimerase [Candidatus Omnitrophota bacterium]|jgi:ADP-L-glycero-D-manno-heptose 6-epimerase|nr:ADP-glyceromanno-heptose 6-epimerase [Candidatus Omnitrophota bacterium]